MPPTVAPEVRYRPATPGDASAISQLYQRVYDQAHDDDVPYPFAQVFDPEWVAHAASGADIAWVVADHAGEVVGTVGAVRNVGDAGDRVAEGFGLVVAPEWRGRRIAAGVFEDLCHGLEGEAHFILAETRTAESGGWRVVRRTGFVPMGFEPFAHVMPVGPESMIMAGRLSAEAAARRLDPGAVTPRVESLARAVLRPLGPPAPFAAPIEACPTAPATWGTLRGYLTPLSPPGLIPPVGGLADDRPFEVVRDDRAAPGLRAVGRAGDSHAAGVVGLRRLEGADRDGRRYVRRDYVGRVGAVILCAARLSWDRLDGRVRILELKAHLDGLAGVMLAAILGEVEREVGSSPLVIVVDVLADRPAIQAALENLGFFPTIYYAGLVARGPGRGDAIQYTRLLGRRLEESTRTVADLAWPEARSVIAAVAGLDPGAGGQLTGIDAS